MYAGFGCVCGVGYQEGLSREPAVQPAASYMKKTFLAWKTTVSAQNARFLGVPLPASVPNIFP